MAAAFLTPEFEVRHVEDIYGTPTVRVTMIPRGPGRSPAIPIIAGSIDVPLCVLDSMIEELGRARACWSSGAAQ